MESAVDIIKLAIENEVRAKAFYESAADLSEEGESQMVFLELIEMESGHARLLVDRFGDLVREAGTDPEALLADLLARIEEGLSGEAARRIESADMHAVVEFAIEMEASARDNYQSLARRVAEPELIDLCRELADEEQSHHDILSRLRVSMDTPPEERPGL